MTFLKRFAFFTATSLALASVAGAQDRDPGGTAPEPGLASPFAFATSGRKAELIERARARGEKTPSSVMGAELAGPGAWPWQVGLLVAGDPTGPESQFCGGSLILDQWVLTAAHCTQTEDGEGYSDVQARQISVIVGTERLAPDAGDVIPVAKIIRHPGYDPARPDNDIALMKLSRKPDTAYQTIRVPDAAFGEQIDETGVPTVVTGWGLIEDSEDPSAMHQAEVQILDRDRCNEVIAQAREAAQGSAQEAPPALTANTLCSGTHDVGMTSCRGVSGGPLVVPLTDGTYIQAGVVSWGVAKDRKMTCAEKPLLSVYTKVSNYVGWMKKTIAAN